MRRINKRTQLTHSSITSPSPMIFGPASSGGFLRASSAASASANCRFNFSKALKRITKGGGCALGV